MGLPRLAAWLWSCLREIVFCQAPNYTIGPLEDPYLHRWILAPRNLLGNVYLHQFCRSDDDRALHDHPWPSVSIVLRGSYVEHTIDAGGIHRRVERRPGDVIFRGPRLAHRVELKPYSRCYTLFLVGPRVRRWGFHCPSGWVDWEAFVAKRPGGNEIGRGCDQ